MRSLMLAFAAIGLCCSTVVAGDPPTPQFWTGRSAAKPTFGNASQFVEKSNPKSAVDPKRPASPPSPARPVNREPEWLRRMDKPDRSTLTGGWALQNWSGGTQSQTTAGDRSGTYAPNTYQGGQFQQWNNVATRQEIPSWNAAVPSYPQQLWSQGYVSPNTYYGADAQSWGNMSAGTMLPNAVSGGWTWR